MEVIQHETMQPRGAHNYKQGALYAAIVVGTFLSGITTAFRCYTRWKAAKRLRKDDWLMCVGLFWSFAVIAAIAHGLTVGLGDDVLNTDYDKKWLLRTSAAVLMMQNLCVFFVKTSILCFNMGIFRGQTFKRVAWAVLVVTAVNSFTGFLIAFLQELAICPRADKQCFGESKYVVPLTTAIIATVCDIVIYIMPIPLLARLGVDRRTKIGLCVVFLLGLLCIGTSFARWAAMIQDHPNNGISMPSDIRISLWTYVELSAGITCGNLPILAPLIGLVNTENTHAITVAPLFYWE
ncbi:hypothetical protein SMACR_09486 [Sordaria macrospora]|uniref:WGS project CABT00000000 data, contig 2.94 n=2 Tax=Sordaria macrospora TaxID=5147 RepID=F7WC38_SORMK|nr:uncharacterized protein SMAC_09486 [Sordaria macrospora k-hell]KAA8623923.1 hypothetical protein SMACR_09486 [Sordaria macrospora]KAH7635375.1 hypothetical protein B0T09DRAFT_389692 [Sordaria sp. MPI-SDFR-AT-0083]WPJ67314.1 hypothetical protein SMAC4_09486 [Sordaria macrospora]CCC05541.1 unnamed protein product [Sordaria macrospora k-hell]